MIYLWADGVYMKAGLDTGKAALLVLIGADAEGRKTVLAVVSGQRESTERWTAVLRDLKRRGLRAPKLTIAEQRCWNHKLRNVLDAVPTKHQAEVKAALQAIASAERHEDATALRDAFTRAYQRAHPKAVACLILQLHA